jgi:2-polyprenyl-3-methyl-5-hydroxy-6-metoxy-1,4-benzoquinol methylase
MDVLAAAYENPRPEIQVRVPTSARRILDLGCASGALGAALKARQDCAVIGVERDPAYAARASERLDDVVVGDLDALDPERLGRFDCVVAGDVLEHLVDPWGVLAGVAELVDSGGTVIVSLPNVRYWETFWQLGIKGTWPKRSLGIFDRTHLRWFTLRDAYDLLDGAGCDVAHVDRLLRLRPEGAPLTSSLLARMPGRTLLTFQHVLTGVRR